MSQPSASARAMPARLSIPPESSAGISDSAPSISSSRKSRRAVRFFCSSVRSVKRSSGKRTFSRTLSEPNSAPPWYITPSRRCSRSRSRASAVTRLRPSMRTSPEIGACRPMIVFMRLDLPLPEPPTMTTISPRPTSNDAFSRRMRLPKPMRRLRTLMTGVACGTDMRVQLVSAATIPSMTMIITMLVTTACVADWPTAIAPAPVERPR